MGNGVLFNSIMSFYIEYLVIYFLATVGFHL